MLENTAIQYQTEMNIKLAYKLYSFCGEVKQYYSTQREEKRLRNIA